MKNYLISIFLLYSITLSSQLMGGFMSPTHTVTDIEGNEYKTVKIGTQIWMAENLRTATYNNGTAIPNVTNGSTWSGLTSGAWCYYNNNSSYNIPYGKLYNWYTMVSLNNLCPTGWRTPTETDYTTLFNYLATDIAGKLKDAGTTYWISSNTGATNETGFKHLPGGNRTSTGSFDYLSELGYLWTRSGPTFNGKYFYMNYSSTTVIFGDGDRKAGYSVRCIKD